MYTVRFSPCVSRFSVDKRAMQEGYCIPTGKKTPGGAGTHTGKAQRVRLLIRSCRLADGLAWNPMGITSLFHGCLFCYILW